MFSTFQRACLKVAAVQPLHHDITEIIEDSTVGRQRVFTERVQDTFAQLEAYTRIAGAAVEQVDEWMRHGQTRVTYLVCHNVRVAYTLQQSIMSTWGQICALIVNNDCAWTNRFIDS
jgi:hypothetical protein